MKIKVLIGIFLFINCIGSTFAAAEVSPKIEKTYKNFVTKLSAGSTDQQVLDKLVRIKILLSNFTSTSRITPGSSKLIHQFQLLNNEKIFELTRKKDFVLGRKIFQKYPILQKFKNKSYDSSLLSLEKGEWYAYIYKTHYIISDLSQITDRNIRFNNFDYDSTLVFYDDGKIFFVADYEKKRIVNDELLSGVVGKKKILLLLREYLVRGGDNSTLDEDIISIKEVSDGLVRDIILRDKKIEKIYAYILKNISYKIDYDISDPAIFSGVKTFRTKTGVCEGYVELFIFLSAFQSIDVQLIDGDVIDAPDFGKIGHAWAKIGSYYYDPTFDDPIGLAKTREKKDYLYYKLPRDLFYVNRFNYGSTPKELYTRGIEERKKLVNKKLHLAYKKYKNFDYNLLQETKLRVENNISTSTPLNLEVFTKFLKAAYYSDKLITVQIGNEKRKLKTFSYYEIKDDTLLLEGILSQLNYDVSDFVLLINTEPDGSIRYYITDDDQF